MTESRVRAAVLEELASRGYLLSPSEHGQDLIGAGVNSASLIQILSMLEEIFDIDFDMEALFSAPLTVIRLEAEITRIAGFDVRSVAGGAGRVAGAVQADGHQDARDQGDGGVDRQHRVHAGEAVLGRGGHNAEQRDADGDADLLA
ncbi:acyl carrier protein [Peterkaempfera bronchialis]|uniref:Acyl carrier protein n=1 Tax=Peterkaempfera bronchialis TaxID=2126346 RepID=A0A345SYQ4_9ACTN|nr:acyl carrier protein [Peterkaempfera bronchialis]